MSFLLSPKKGDLSAERCLTLSSQHYWNRSTPRENAPHVQDRRVHTSQWEKITNEKITTRWAKIAQNRNWYLKKWHNSKVVILLSVKWNWFGNPFRAMTTISISGRLPVKLMGAGCTILQPTNKKVWNSLFRSWICKIILEPEVYWNLLVVQTVVPGISLFGRPKIPTNSVPLRRKAPKNSLTSFGSLKKDWLSQLYVHI